MKILLTGKNGQLGQALQTRLHELVGLGGALVEVLAVDRTQMDLSNPESCRALMQSFQPDLVINAAAYTAVDKAEQEEALAFAVNAEAPKILAEEAAKLGAALIHYSTDYVFDGSKQGAWTEEDVPHPLSVYGRSKLAGEQAVIASGVPHFIFRTSWVYSLVGQNFLLTMLRLAKERKELSIVADQHGAPTWTHTIADATVRVIQQLQQQGKLTEQMQKCGGIYHLVAGEQTTWFGFAQSIFAHSSVLNKPQCHPITTEQYPLPAPRPKNSVLSTKKFQQQFFALPSWQQALTACQQDL
jgi:dTDP-4-dehydrorhamnose reductase